MSYLFKQKFNLFELAKPPKIGKKVVLAEPEEILMKIYIRHLEDGNFVVQPAKNCWELESLIQATLPDLLVLNPCIFPADFPLINFLNLTRKHFPSLPIITIGSDFKPDNIKKIMRYGVASHIDRKFSRPQDLVHIIEAILINN